jgi:phosphomannomutase
MAKGKTTCRILKEIRRQIAEANDIEYVVEECQYKGDCKGTCPKCEAEVRYLESQLHKRQMLGKAVVVAGLSLGVIPAMAQEVSAVETKVAATVAAQSDGISGKYIISGNVCAKENLGKTSTLICASVKTTGGDNNPEKSVDTSSADIKSINFMDTYASYLQKKIRDGVGKGDKPLEGLHIIVDAGNGAGGFYVTKVLEPLGADTSGSQFLTPDGRFPNHIPNPENKEAAESIKKATLDSKADLGIIFDTDVDRAGAVLPSGKTLTRNDLIAVLSMIALSEHPGTTIVTDSVTSDGLHDFIEAHGGKHKRFKRGYRNVIDESIRLNNEGIDSQLAIETSGHGAFKENYFLDDGAYLMVKLLIEMGKGKKLEEMIKDLSEPCESDEIRFPVYADKIEGGDLQPNGDRILKMLEEAAGKVEGWSLPESNYEGVRVNTDKNHGDGWLLLRKSLHEPIMPLNIESNTKGGNLIMATKLKEILAGEDTLDQSPLDAFIGK